MGVLSEGFDEPRLACVLLLRPTHSRGLYIQQVGRGLRPCPPHTPTGDGSGDVAFDEVSTWSGGGDDDEAESTAAENARRLVGAARAAACGKEDCVVIDCAGNIGRFGPIVGPGPAYAWEDDDDDDCAAPAARSCKVVPQTPPLARCACGAISHEQVAQCAGCGSRVRPPAATKQRTKAQLDSFRAFRATEGGAASGLAAREASVPGPKNIGATAPLRLRDGNASHRGQAVAKGERRTQERKLEKPEGTARAPEDRRLKVGEKEPTKPPSSKAPLSPLPR